MSDDYDERRDAAAAAVAADVRNSSVCQAYTRGLFLFIFAESFISKILHFVAL